MKTKTSRLERIASKEGKVVSESKQAANQTGVAPGVAWGKRFQKLNNREIIAASVA
ncbi:hypothetical protein T11_12654 [Trichinella zimbabwensis]|uniref:Uncharacterized protein n=1 Tax=Trichinella zimbabwensis TaxID=268475 RepID=A0A0V1G8Z5_9BILA|nr:hypothetical protein T11_12654 [Trichinella zimbabwensis]